MTFTAAVAHGIFNALWFRQEYLREHALDACTELTHEQGNDAMKIWRKHFADTEGNNKRNAFWACIGRTAVSKTLAMLIINAGPNQEALVRNVSAFASKKFCQDHLAFVQTNRHQLKDFALMTKRRLVQLKKLRWNLKKQDGKSSSTRIPMAELPERIAQAQADFDAVKRQAPNLFRDALQQHLELTSPKRRIL